MTALRYLTHKTTNFWNTAGLMIWSRDTIGTVTVNGYDDSGNMITNAVLQGPGNVIVPENAILSSHSYGFDLNGNQTISVTWFHIGTNWVGSTTITIFDAQNRVIGSVDPNGATNSVVLDDAGQQVATIDKLGHRTDYTRDFQERVVGTTFPDLSTNGVAFDPAGNRTNSTDQLGRVTTFVPDALNRITQTIYADGAANLTIFDDLGRVRFSVDARGVTNAPGYDQAGQRIVMTNALGTPQQAIWQYGFDPNGNEIFTIDPNGHGTTNVFDELNRQIKTLFADSTGTTNAFDAAGNKIGETNQDGIITLFTLNGLGALVAVTNAFNTTNQIATVYLRDEAGNVIQQIDANNHANLFGFNLLGQKVWHQTPGNQVEGWAYDLNGNNTFHTNFNGALISNAFDLMNRMTNTTSINGYHVSRMFDAAGNRTNMTDMSGSTSYIFDLRNRLSHKTVNWAGGLSITLNYAMDANGNVTNIWSSSTGGVNLQYSLDPLNRITNVLANGAFAAAYGFDPAGNTATARYGNGVTNLCQFDLLNRLTNMTWKLNTNTMASFAYQLGKTGSRTGLTETNHGTSRTNGWTYDPLYRLRSETISDFGTVNYGLDAVGNRTNRDSYISQIPSTTSSFGPNDWLDSDTYDSDGNTAISSGNPYYYNAVDELTNAVFAEIVNGIVVGVSVQMRYDGDHNRVTKSVGGTNTFYLVDDQNPTGFPQVLEEWIAVGGSTNLNRVYNYGLQLVSQVQLGTSTNYLTFDGHGSTRLLTDSGGTVVNTFTFDAYGILLASEAAPQTAYLYCGEQYDADLGMYYLRARYYQPQTGRFWTMDTFEGNNEDPLSLHKYLYANGDPVNVIDPSGHDGTYAEALSMTSVEGVLMSLALSAVATAIIEMPFRDWSIYKGFEINPFHAYVAAGRSGDSLMYRYDIAVDRRTWLQALKNPLKHFKCYVLVEHVPREEALTGLSIKVAKLSESVTFGWWNKSVIGTPYPMDGDRVTYDYVLLYKNCYYYSGIFAARALFLSLLPF
ncbi:MAG: hypothetical protein C5B50_14080 [Verrucomicrobia bacterium]|nr:MAG: hypothetical protein C5B50_14080 [Verrucomicrobiota bacterium]